ncbi:MAG: DUF4405 domain-containing protein [Desulfovibrionaceae bacterium]
MRKITSLTALCSFLVLTLTSVVLYIVPEGRVAYWSDWKLWGMTKGQWGDVHVTIGVLFLIAICLHLWYNWKPIVLYLKNRARALRVFTPAGTIAMALTAMTVAGTLLMAPPFSWVLHLGESFKDNAAATYGEPPYGHAELSTMQTFAKRMALDLDVALAALDKAGIRTEGAQDTMLAIAQRNGITPKAVYEAITAAQPAPAPGAAAFPDAPPPGFGRRTLADVCSEYSLHPPDMVRALKAAGMTARVEQTVKEIAADAGVDPTAVFTVLQRAATAR